ncbi:MAG: putative baseplate assembly protein [Firmicutes bacterium]|nr:putative baseplate assembly protein [Bacillota bacterium]
MLPLPNLDDRNFRQIAEESIRAIHKLFPEWTDENFHDPGITLIELFAWLTEMQAYYLDQISHQNKLKFLKLLGVDMRQAVPSRAEVSFSGVTRRFILPKGTQVAAADQVFETVEPILLIPSQIEKIIVLSEGRYQDVTSFNDSRGLSFFAFGREARRHDRFYLGLNQPLPLGQEVALSVSLFDDYPVPRTPLETGSFDLVPSAQVSWYYYGETGIDGADWRPMEVSRDDTLDLSQSGQVLMTAPTAMKPSKMPLAADLARYWVCCQLERPGYEVVPRIERAAFNTVGAVNRQTMSQVYEFDGSGEPGTEIVLSDHLSNSGVVEVQLRDRDGGWRFCPEVKEGSEGRPGENRYTRSFNPDTKEIVIRLEGPVPGTGGEANVRAVSYRPEFRERRLLGRSNGLPHQSFPIPWSRIQKAGFRLQVGNRVKGGSGYSWQDWTMVPDFDTSGPEDRHYRLDEETGEIVFGDNEHGMAPGMSEHDNVLILALQVGGSERGNVREGEINEVLTLPAENPGIQVTNAYPSRGGMDPEGFEHALRRFRQELKRPTRAVTSEDYERIAMETPGLRVARAKALPLYTKGMSDYPRRHAPAQVTVVVVPFSESVKPATSPGFLETVRRHLDRYRLITTRVQVIPAEYIRITVYAVVVVNPDSQMDSRKVTSGLDRYLQPLDKSDGGGWPFGRSVYKGDIYGVITRMEGVVYIQDLQLNAEGPGVFKDANGDIGLPPYGLPYLGDCEIRVIKTTDL